MRDPERLEIRFFDVNYGVRISSRTVLDELTPRTEFCCDSAEFEAFIHMIDRQQPLNSTFQQLGGVWIAHH